MIKKYSLLRFCLVTLLLFSGTNNIVAQVNTKNADGTYNQYGYKQWSEDNKSRQFQQSANAALTKNTQTVTAKNTSSSELYTPVQSKADAANNNKCISGNCENGYGTWQGSPGGIYKYIGESKNGEWHGKGQAYDWEGYLTFDGNWAEGEQDGFGKEIVYRQERVFGDGSITHYNTSLEKVYKGDFKKGSYNGKGTLDEYDKGQNLNSTYIGDFKQNKKEGQGVILYLIGDEISAYYSGEWRNNVREGTGVDSTGWGGLYIGDFKENFRSGQGTAYWPVKEAGTNKPILKYVGNWRISSPDSMGTEYDKQGKIVFEGNFKMGVRDGKGKLYKADGTAMEGIWVNGVNKEIDPSSVPKANVVLKEINENFENKNANNWPDNSYSGCTIEIKKGVYKVRSGLKGYGNTKIPLPGGISFSSDDDWSFEITAKQTGGNRIGYWGLGWDDGKFLVHQMDVFDWNYKDMKNYTGHYPKNSYNVKKGNNTLRVIKKRSSIEFYLNNNLFYTGTTGNMSSKGLYLMMEERAREDNFEVEFKEVVFKILK